jgi:hypothetical protein
VFLSNLRNANDTVERNISASSFARKLYSIFPAGHQESKKIAEMRRFRLAGFITTAGFSGEISTVA